MWFKVFVKWIGLALFSFRMFPIYVTYLIEVICGNKEIVKYKKDVGYFKLGFFSLLYERPEYICVLYMRLGYISRFLRYYKKSYPCFLSESRYIGEGVYIDHPHGSHVNVRRCGKNLHIKHNVTVGNNHGGLPTLGDNVSIGCGACILGDIVVGSNVKIGANCVVVKNVPDNVTVVGNPAVIVKQSGLRTNIPL